MDNMENNDLNTMPMITYYSLQEEKEFYDNSKYLKLSLSNLSTIGVASESIISLVQYVMGNEYASGLCRISYPKGTTLAKLKDGTGHIGTYLGKNGAIQGQARINPIVFDPTNVFMATTLYNIEKKLDDIKEIQKDIYDYLIIQERAKLKDDLADLNDILDNYKFNWNNAMYKSNKHILVQKIRQDAGQGILKQKDLINNELNKNTIIKSKQESEKLINKICDILGEYQLSIYLYAYASFLEVMLLENFDYQYIDNVISKMMQNAVDYKIFYSQCFDIIKNKMNLSMQTKITKGVSHISKNIGKTLKTIPIVNQLKLEDDLMDLGAKLEQDINRNISDSLKKLIDKKDILIIPFIENLNTVKTIYNQPLEILIDKDNIYLENIILK